MVIWVSREIGKHNNQGEVGYSLKTKYRGKGIASEADKAIINFGFSKMKINRIMANTNPLKTVSQDLLIKLGFIREAQFRQNYYFDGKHLDSDIYGLIKVDLKY